MSQKHDWLAEIMDFGPWRLEGLEREGYEIVSVQVVQRYPYPGREPNYMASDPDRMAVVAKRKWKKPPIVDLSWFRWRNPRTSWRNLKYRVSKWGKPSTRWRNERT